MSYGRVDSVPGPEYVGEFLQNVTATAACARISAWKRFQRRRLNQD